MKNREKERRTKARETEGRDRLLEEVIWLLGGLISLYHRGGGRSGESEKQKRREKEVKNGKGETDERSKRQKAGTEDTGRGEMAVW